MYPATAPFSPLTLLASSNENGGNVELVGSTIGSPPALLLSSAQVGHTRAHQAKTMMAGGSMSKLGPDTCGEHLIDTRALIDAVTRAVQMAVPEDEAEAEAFWETCGAALNLLFVCVDAAKRRQETARATPAPVFFRSKFRWEPGEYVLTLNVKAEPERASVSSRYRITLFESDSKELPGYCGGYKFGYGVFLDSPKTTGIIVPIAEG